MSNRDTEYQGRGRPRLTDVSHESAPRKKADRSNQRLVTINNETKALLDEYKAKLSEELGFAVTHSQCLSHLIRKAMK